MPNGVFNWTFKDVESFLKEHNFRLNHIEGSHYFYTGTINTTPRQVSVPRHGAVAFKPRTLKGMIAQSGISQKEWIGK